MTNYAWAVVGAGPAGITAVGKLIDQGVEPSSIVWIDPAFTVGDLGKSWMNVSSNTKVNLFIAHLKATQAFNYEANCLPCQLETLDPNDTCQLSYAVAPLQQVSDNLVKKVVSKQACVTSAHKTDQGWSLGCDDQTVVNADQVILTIGAEPKEMNYDVPTMPLTLALNPERIQAEVNPDQTIAVFGSSHSAVLIMKYLLERGCKVINFYRSPLLYAIYHDDWIEFDNTGLKGLAARWAKQNLDDGNTYPGLQRYPSDEQHIAEYLPQCDQAVYAIGFCARQIDGIDCSNYDQTTGVIAPGLYGFGIAFPEKVVDRVGHQEFSVGLWKFNVYAERVIPQWVQDQVVS